MTAAFEVSERTLAETLDSLARFGAAGPGVTRLAYDRAWGEAHRWLRLRQGAQMLVRHAVVVD